MMEIKWWDTHRHKYVESEDYFINSELKVFHVERDAYETWVSDLGGAIEPHFYLKGVRVRYDD